MMKAVDPKKAKQMQKEEIKEKKKDIHENINEAKRLEKDLSDFINDKKKAKKMLKEADRDYFDMKKETKLKRVEGFNFEIPEDSEVIGIITESKEVYNIILSPKTYAE